MNQEDPLSFLQEWYRAQCNGDWEHSYGVAIGNIDNPGWSIAIDLTGSDLEGARLDYRVLRDSEPDWVHCWSEGAKFEAATGPLGLTSGLAEFRSFANHHLGRVGDSS